MSVAELFGDHPPAFPLDGVMKADVDTIMGAPEFPALIAEYAAESSVLGMPSPHARMESYRLIERTGTLHAFAAIESGALVGFITVLSPILPHYDMRIAVCESFFVAVAHRKGAIGLRMLARAEEQARQVDSPVLLVSTPIGGRLGLLLPKCGYTATNVVYLKRLSHDA